MVHLALASSLRPHLLVTSSCFSKFTARSYSALASPSASNSVSPVDTLKQSRIDGLKDALLREGNPSRVWAHYTNILNYFSYDVLPIELHQQVLRQCTPPARTLRLSAARRLLRGQRPEIPHLHEGRFQTVVSNIRALGLTPSLEDYHFILEQLAAVGHHIGSLQVYKELVHLGLNPEPKTYGLCLQAIAHRLTLPITKLYRIRLLSQTRKTLDDLISDMRKFQIPFTSSNLDLAIRIFRETTDKEGFDTLVKWAYGIDLANPDRPPLDYLDTQTPFSPLPTQTFSTHSLNTIIDTLGRLGDVSKLIQAFEVLTQPLPRASQHLFTSFDDDDDFGVPADTPAAPSFTPPYASPNTTTYNMLLYYITRSGHATLARHYLLQAMWLDRMTSHRLRSQIRLKEPLEKIKAPHFSINRRMLLSVFHQTNRRKNLSLMQWLSTKLPRVLRRKKGDLEYYIALRDKLRGSLASSPIATKTENEPSSQTLSLPSKEFVSLLPPTPISRQSSIMIDVRKVGTAFDVDVNDQSIPEPPPDKMFDIDLHIQVLTRDLAKISEFAEVLDKALGRTHQRVKERLGRRVWASKDIYLATEDRRIAITRDRWREIVHFKPRRDLVKRLQRLREPPSLLERHRDSAPHLELQRSYSTSLNKQLPEQIFTTTIAARLRSFLSS